MWLASRVGDQTIRSDPTRFTERKRRLQQAWERLRRTIERADRRVFPWLIVGVYVLVVARAAAHHEMWRDEIQAWLLARDSSGLLDLCRNLKYEGHPGLWHLTLMPLTRITWAPEIMQVWHLLIAATVMFLILRYGPFPLPLRALIPFGYFAVFEYAVKCRNYALGWLLLTTAVLLYPHRRRLLPWIGLALMLAAHTTVFPLIITIVLTGVLGLEALIELLRGRMDRSWGSLRPYAIGLGLALFGILTSVVQIVPPEDTGFAVGWRFQWDPNHFKNVLLLYRRVWAPPHLDWLESSPYFGALRWWVSGGIVVWTVALFWRRPFGLLFYLGATAGVLAFNYVKYFGAIWHHGQLFVIFLLVHWMERASRPAEPMRGERWLFRFSNLALGGVLILQLLSGIGVLQEDARRPFSNGKAAGRFLREHGLTKRPILGDYDAAVSTVVGYARLPKIFYARGERWGSFVVWDKARTQGVSQEQLMALWERLGPETVLLTNYRVREELLAPHGLQEWAAFTGAMVGDENFFIYGQGPPP
ncbi:MAG: hypothetical protein KatS3mg115_1338 [Candidatus Poribacteria bacterium]|nr:MAG: hypothetical protein KatS3mg115_1338 [Candidatus Poribacteria bacterium]